MFQFNPFQGTINAVTSETDEVDLEKQRSQLLLDLKATKGARFNAAERLGQRDKHNITVIAVASVYVITLTLLPVFFHTSERISVFLNLATVSFSLVILVASLLQYSNADPVQIEQYHRCGLELNAIRRELRATDPLTAEALIASGKRFDDVLQKYSINHDTVDFDRYKTEHPDEFEGTTAEKQSRLSVNLLSQINKSAVEIMTAIMIALGIILMIWFD